jgi:hypothetical protein
MNTHQDYRARLNPQDLRISDVILGKGRIDPGMLLVNRRRRRGAATWSRTQCWLLLQAVMAVVIFTMYEMAK